MPKPVPFLDCCGQPMLEVVKMYRATHGETISIRRCVGCGAYWFYHMKEYSLSSGDYDRRAWYVRLSSEEAEALVELPEPPPSSRFADRDGIMRSEDGISKIQGIPSFIE
jgi:hypothetical protein